MPERVGLAQLAGSGLAQRMVDGRDPLGHAGLSLRPGSMRGRSATSCLRPARSAASTTPTLGLVDAGLDRLVHDARQHIRRQRFRLGREALEGAVVARLGRRLGQVVCGDLGRSHDQAGKADRAAGAVGEGLDVLGQRREHVHAARVVVADVQDLDGGIARELDGELVLHGEAVEAAAAEHRDVVGIGDARQLGHHAASLTPQVQLHRLPRLAVHAEARRHPRASYRPALPCCPSRGRPRGQHRRRESRPWG